LATVYNSQDFHASVQNWKLGK